MKGYFYIIAAAILWGFIGPMSKMAFDEGILPMEVAFWRASLAWIFFAAHAMITKKIGIRAKDLPMVVLFAILGITVFYGAYQLAVQAGGAAFASVLLYTAPAWVTVMARFAFKEVLTPVKLTALGLTLTGVVLVGSGGGSVEITLPAILFGLTSGFCYSLYYIFGKYFSSRYTSPNLFLYMLPIGAISLLPWVEFTHKSTTAWAALLFSGFLSTYGAYFFYYQGVKLMEASQAAITATLEPVVAAVVAYLWWKETFSLLGYLGGAAILSAVILMAASGRR